MLIYNFEKVFEVQMNINIFIYLYLYLFLYLYRVFSVQKITVLFFGFYFRNESSENPYFMRLSRIVRK